MSSMEANGAPGRGSRALTNSGSAVWGDDVGRDWGSGMGDQPCRVRPLLLPTGTTPWTVAEVTPAALGEIRLVCRRCSGR